MKIGEIEKDVPIPEIIRKGKYVNSLRQMEVGDSFLITPEGNQTVKRIQISITASIRHLRKTKDIRIVTRNINGGLRVWRFE